MTTFLALYRGATVSEAKMVAVTAEPRLVRDFAGCLLNSEPGDREADAVIDELEDGRRRALRLVLDGEEN